MAEEFNLSIYNDVYDMSFNQETEEIHIELKQGYYPLSNNVDLSNYYTKPQSDSRYKSINYVPNWGSIDGNIENQTDLIQKFGNYYTKTEVYNKNEVNSELNNKQDKLNADVLGQVLDTELSIKMTPSADDEIVILDSITGDAATVKFSSFGGNVDLSNYYTKTETYSKVEVDNLLDDKQDVIAYTPENYANKSDSYTASSSTTYASTKALVDGLATKLDKGGYTGNAQDLKNEIDTKQKKLSSFDESILIESDGNIEGNVSLFTEYFNQQVCELNFNPIQIVGVYQDGIRLSNSEYEIILPKKIKIKGYVDENIEIQYTHLKS